MGKNYSYDNGTVRRQSESNNTGDKVTYLLIGGGIGALVALLFAPKAGQELRGDIAEATRKGYDKTLETAQQLKDQSGNYYQQIKEQAGGVYDAAAVKIKGVAQQTGASSNEGSKALNEIKDGSDKIVDSAKQAVTNVADSQKL